MEALVKNFGPSDALAEYLMETCSGDGLEFWLDVEFFKRLDDPQEIKTKAKQIYSTYLMPTSPKEIVLDPLLKHSLLRVMSSRDPVCHIAMFNGAQDAVENVLTSRCKLASSDSMIKRERDVEDMKSSRFALKRENTFPKPLSSKLQQYNRTVTKEKSLINFDVST